MLLRDIRRYAKALWRQSVPLLTGGGLMALLAIYGLSTGATLPQNIAWLVLGLTFIAASFLAWRKEEAEKDALMNEKDAALKLQVERDNRIFLSSQPNQLLPRAGTAVQRKFQSSVYLGKWIRVDGKVQDVSEKYTGKVEALAKLTDGTVCYLGFDRNGERE